ncbi:hypothetical protein ACFZAV_16700 [Streptomyces sp. NPDC008343]|uniref:hypothetical protein n=1 Tax=Streptomyces sp. NPDC008343 TaxID=3364828 RepID=UPI0036E3CA0D
MSEAEAVRSVIARLRTHADEPETQRIHELARQAGYLWRCGNPACPAYNCRGRRYCEGCGWGRRASRSATFTRACTPSAGGPRCAAR